MPDYTTIFSPLSSETLSRETLPDKTSALLFDASIEGIVADSIMDGVTTSKLTIKDGYIQSSNFSSTTGWKLTNTSADLNTGITITGYLTTATVLDDLADSTYAKVLNTDITAGHILLSECTGYLDDIINSAYGKVLTTDISAGHILLSECTGYLDDITNSAYSKVLTTDISAGHITVVGTSASININDITFGSAGIQLQYNSGTPRAYIGDGSTKSFSFDGTDVNLGADTTINGRVASTISAAINSSGNLITDIITTTLDSSSKEILSDFNFGTDDYAGAVKAGDITWNTTTGVLTGGTGIVVSRYGIMGASHGSATFTILSSSGDATFAGTLSAPSGTLGSITAGTLDAVNISGSEITGTTIKAIESFTAGEAITAGNVVCIKGAYTSTVYSDADTYADERFASANYGTAITMRVGNISGSAQYAYVSFDESAFPDAQHIQKAELHFHAINTFGDAQELKVHRVTETWIATAVTWSAKPDVTSDVYEPGGYTTKSGVLAETDYFIDITELARNWKLGAYTNYGLRISNVDAVNDYCDMGTVENATTSDRVSLRITATNESDEKIYKTDSDDYNLCRNIIGIATTSVSTDATCTVQTMGKNDDVTASGIGDIYYISPTAGDVTNDVVNQTRLIKIGTVTTTNELLIEKDNSNIFIESFGPARFEAASTEHAIPLPPDTRYAIIKYKANVGKSYSWEGSVRIDATTYTNVVVREAQTAANKVFEITISYSSNGLKMVIDSQTAASGAADYLEYTVYFFK